MDMYTDPFESDTPKERSLAAKIIIGIFKTIGILFIVSIFLIIFIRLQLWKTPKEFKDFAFTDEATSYLAENGELVVGYQEPYTEFDENGYYHISDVSFARDLGEIQLTVRYNSRSTINYLMAAYGLTDRPTGETFIYILTDDDGNEYKSYRFAAKDKPLSDFRRIIFDGVDFSTTENLYLHVYYGEDVSNYDSTDINEDVKAKSKLHATFTVYETDRWIDEKTFTESSKMSYSLTNNPAYIDKRSEN